MECDKKMKRIALGVVMLFIAFELAQECAGAFLEETVGTIGMILLTMFFLVIGLSFVGIMSFTGVLKKVGL